MDNPKESRIANVPKFDWTDLLDADDYRPYSFWDKTTEKLKNNPLIPFGVLATCGALSYGLISFARGDKMKQQYMMRARVSFQALTVVLIGIGSLREIWKQ